MAEAVIVERDYKGEFERFALTQQKFIDAFGSHFHDGMPEPCNVVNSYTLYPLVHLWYRTAEIGGELWNKFFTDLSWGLSETDIASGNLAYIRTDFMASLQSFLPQALPVSLDSKIKSAAERTLSLAADTGKYHGFSQEH